MPYGEGGWRGCLMVRLGGGWDLGEGGVPYGEGGWRVGVVL